MFSTLLKTEIIIWVAFNYLSVIPFYLVKLEILATIIELAQVKNIWNHQY